MLLKDSISDIEKEIYLGIFRKFNILRVRMKLSYMATCQLKTVKEFLLEGIVNSFIHLRGQGLLVDADNEKYDDKFF